MFCKFAVPRKRTNKECFIVFVLENSQPIKKKPDGIIKTRSGHRSMHLRISQHVRHIKVYFQYNPVKNIEVLYL